MREGKMRTLLARALLLTCVSGQHVLDVADQVGQTLFFANDRLELLSLTKESSVMRRNVSLEGGEGVKSFGRLCLTSGSAIWSDQSAPFLCTSCLASAFDGYVVKDSQVFSLKMSADGTSMRLSPSPLKSGHILALHG